MSGRAGIAEADYGYTIISEPVKVEFRPRARALVIEDELRRLGEAENTKRAEFETALQHIEDERRKLLAITYDPEGES